MQLWGMSLLELCADKLHCYISDLACPILNKNKQMKEALLCELMHIDAIQSDVHEWNEGISYILGENRAFDQAENAKEYLIQQLEE